MAKRRRRKKTRATKFFFGFIVLAAIAALLAVLLLWHPNHGPSRHAIARGTPAATILFTCDLRGRLTPRTCEEGTLGGIARIATLFAQWAGERPDCVIADVGNATAGSHPEAKTINPLACQALDALGTAVVNCGTHEAALPHDQLKGLASDLRKFTMISANLIDAATGNTVFPAHHIVAVAGTRVAFIGLVHATALGKGLRLIEPEDALRAALTAIGDDADLVVVLAYLPPDKIYDLAGKFDAVNIFLGGNAQASSAPYETVRDAFIAYLGDDGAAVGSLHASFPRTGRPVATGTIRRLGDDLADADATKPILAKFTQAIPPAKRPGADHDPKMPCTASFVGSDVCKLCHISEYYSWQATAHAGAYVTLLQNKKHHDPTCLPCHVAGYRMPDGYDTRLQAVANEKDPKKRQSRQRGLDALKNVGCESCHGGARRHVAVALRDRTAAAKTPYQRPDISTHNCTRCHTPARPCLPKNTADPYSEQDYLVKIKHWQ